jgi:hypothetical protein
MAAPSHAKGRSKPHQKGADMSMPARTTTTPVRRGKLDITDAAGHRRVLAVLTYLHEAGGAAT